MKKVFGISLMVLVLFFSLFSLNTFANDEKNERDYVEGELIVSIEQKKVKNKSAIETMNSTTDLLEESDVLEENGFTLIDSMFEGKVRNSTGAFSQNFSEKAIKKMGYVYLIEYSTQEYASPKEAQKVLNKLLKDLDLKVKHVNKNYKVSMLEGDLSAQQVESSMHENQVWHYEMINAPQAWEITPGSSEVTVAVLDTGIDSDHPSLSNFVDTSLGETFVGGTPEDVQGHGTHVAGTIASYGEVSGVMQEATLVAVKVLGDDGSGSSYGIQQGILYAADINADVINMSLGGGGYDQGTSDAIDTANEAGTVVVAASGNDGASSVSYPAGYDGAIAVGSVTSTETRSNFSNYGEGLEVMAPGSDIYSTYPDGQYRTYSGTSMASPHAAGVAGMIRAIDSTLSVSEVRNILSNTAQDAGDAYQYGNGIVDTLAAVQAAGGEKGNDESYQTVTDVSTNYSYYFQGENVTITAEVNDETGQALSNANVLFTITRPNGSTLTNNVLTNSSGVATWTVSTSSSTATGTYQVEAQTTLDGYEGSSSTTSFDVY